MQLQCCTKWCSYARLLLYCKLIPAYSAPAEFQYPGDWLADQNMYKRRAQRIERSNGLDPAAPTRYDVSLFTLPS